MRKRGLFHDRSGAAALEFAMVALPFFMLTIGFVVVANRLWSWQALTTVAGETARCAGIGASSCASVTTSTTATITYAVSTIAPQYGFTGLTASNVTVETGASAKTACNNTTANVVYVSISYTYSWTPPIVLFPATISASSCFPLSSS